MSEPSAEIDRHALINGGSVLLADGEAASLAVPGGDAEGVTSTDENAVTGVFVYPVATSEPDQGFVESSLFGAIAGVGGPGQADLTVETVSAGSGTVSFASFEFSSNDGSGYGTVGVGQLDGRLVLFMSFDGDDGDKARARFDTLAASYISPTQAG